MAGSDEGKRASDGADALYWTILDNLEEGILLMDAGGAIKACNPRAEDILGLSRKEMAGLTSFDHRWQTVHEDGNPFPAEDLPAVKALRTGETVRREIIGVSRPGGEACWLQVTAQPLFHPGETAAHAVLVSFQDMTEKRAADEALKRSEARLRTLVQNASDLVTVLDETGTILFQSPSSERILGFAPDEMTDKSLFDYVHPSDAPMLRKAFEDAVGRPDERIVAEFRAHRKDGTWIDLEALGSNLLDNPALAGFLLATRDVTGTKSVLDKLRLLDRAIGASVNGIVITDATLPDNPIIYANAAFERITGYPLHEVLGRNCRFLQGEDRRQVSLGEIRRAIRTNREGSAVLRNYRKDGRLFWNELHIAPVRNENGQVTHFVGVQNDITEKLTTEFALKKSEAQFKAMFEGAGLGIVMIDMHGKVIAANPAIEDMLGYSADELRTLTLEEVTFEQDRLLDLGLFRDLQVGTRESYRVEKRFLRKDGTRFWGGLSVSIARSPAENTQFAIAMLADVSRRREAEQALRRRDAVLEASGMAAELLLKSEDWEGGISEVIDRLGLALDASTVYLYAIDEHNEGRLYARRLAAWTNPEAEALNLVPEPPLTLAVEDRVTLDRLASLASGAILSDPEHRDGNTCPPRFPFGDGGSRLLVPIFAGALWWGFLGLEDRHTSRQWSMAETEVLRTLAGIFGAAVLRTRNLRALRESEARIRSIFDNMLGGLVTLREDGTIDMVNPSAERMFGYKTYELAGRHFSELLPQVPADEREGLMQIALKKTLGRVTEWEARKKDGTLFPVELSLFEFHTPEGRSFAGNVRDISQRREVDRLKREFVSMVSHELRTPLTSIRGALGLLAEGGLGSDVPEQAKQLIDVAFKNSGRLGRLVDDILDMDKLEAGKMAFHMRPLPIVPIVEQAIAANAAYAAELGVSFALTGTATGAQVQADPDRLSQVLANLLSNAAKFSPEGDTVEISVERAAKVVRVAVRDRGPGVPDAFRSEIFSKFAQADNASARRKGGTGLGLSISKVFIEKMGGRIDFISAEGRGTTFFFELPEYEGGSFGTAERSG
jgi:PAS domain S-box-containing protein